MLEWHADPAVNMICRVGGSGCRLLDEIGFAVRYITPDGFLLFDIAQETRFISPQRRYMIGQVAQVIGRYGIVAEGVFAAASGHTLTRT
jgi:putative aminopeptidase FrvX